MRTWLPYLPLGLIVTCWVAFVAVFQIQDFAEKNLVAIGLSVVMVLAIPLDAYLLRQRSKQPGFNAWDEI